MRGVWFSLALCLAVAPLAAADQYPVDVNGQQCNMQSEMPQACGVVEPCVLKERGSDNLNLAYRPVRLSPSHSDTGVEIWLPDGGITYGTWYFNGICADFDAHL
jgi:hypothetical protein